LSYRCTYKTLVNEEGCHFVMAPRVILKHSNANDPGSLNVYTLEVSNYLKMLLYVPGMWKRKLEAEAEAMEAVKFL